MLNNQLNVLASMNASLEGKYTLKQFDSSLEKLFGKRVLFRTDYSKECIPLQCFKNVSEGLGLEAPRRFSAQPRERLVAGIDSSCVLIGETEDGAIYAGRSAAVFSFGSKIQSYRRIGPVIFYLNNENAREFLRGLGLSLKLEKVLLSDHNIAERFLRIVVERFAQAQIAGGTSDALLLIDGALRNSIFEPRGFSLKDVEKKCEQNFNQLIGVSKASGLSLVAAVCSELSTCKEGSLYYDITTTLRILMPNVTARVLIVKFSANSPVFRVDLSPCNLEEDPQVLSDLKHNDVLYRGYPETLRLAHHLCTMDSALISSIRGYLSRKYRLTQVPSDDLRATVLGKLV